MKKIHFIASAALIALTPLAAYAEDAAAPAPAAPTPPSLMPAMTGPLNANANPYSFDAGTFGKIYVSGAAGGIGLWQSNATSNDHRSEADLTNAQVFIQKPDGVVQFFLQGGGYSTPDLGTPYFRADKLTDNTFNFLPQGFLKLAPTSNFSIEAGKLPTLFGAEYTFTFENMNIERGLLWNQENAVNRGVQANYSQGPLSFALSWNDGFYSNRYDWVSGSAAWTINSENSLSLVAGGNVNHTNYSSFATPLAQNNGQIYNLIYTYNSGPLTINPYVQYTYVPQDTGVGIADKASTLGAAVLGKYTFNPNWSLAGRVEYIDSNGSAAGPNLLYGQNSNAWSATITPTYQYKTFFGRAEASYTHAGNITPGDAFGPTGNDKAQARLLLEAGVLF